MKEKIIQTFYQIGASPIGKFLSQWTSSDVQILMYHRVLPNSDYTREGAGISTSTNLFESHLQLLKKEFTVISIQDVLNLEKIESLTKPAVVITFDDGYKDNIQYALPLLAKYEVPATFYLTTRMLDQDLVMWWYEIDHWVQKNENLNFSWNSCHFNLPLSSRSQKKTAYLLIRKLFIDSSPLQQKELLEEIKKNCAPEDCVYPQALTWEDAKEMSRNSLVTIGAHTLNHPILSRLGPEEIRKEVLGSKKVIEDHLQLPVEHFAYPFGSHIEAGQREYDLIRSMGFKTAVTTLASPLSLKRVDHQALPRLAIKKRTTAEHLRVKLSGWNYLWNGIQI